MHNVKKIIINQYFKPAWWLKNPHAQTIWPIVRRPKIWFKEHWQRIDLPDGDFVDLVWDASNYQDRSKPVALLLHGMEGGIQSGYVRGLMQGFSKHGYRPVLMHFRGCSGFPNRLLRSYHCGDTYDLSYIVNQVLLKQHTGKMVAVGISLGGNVLLKWLGETKDNNPLYKCVAISVPFEIDNVVFKIMKGMSRVYQWWLLRDLKTKVKHKVDKVSGSITVQEVKLIRNFLQFDELITAPMHGFDSATNYYKTSSCRQYLSTISVPTLIVHSRDDPLMTPKSIPTEDELSNNVQLLLADKGGHVGFVEGKAPGLEQYWLDHFVPSFLGCDKLLRSS